MIARCRLLLGVAWSVGAGFVTLRGEMPPSPVVASAMTPELAALAATLPAWSSVANIETGFGFKDNLLLSHAGEEGSAFARGGVNATASRLRLGDRTDYSFGLTAEATRYFSGASVTHESKAFGLAKWRYRVEDTFKFSFDAQGYYQDQVFDVSDTDALRIVAQLKVAGVVVGPTIRWAPIKWAWIEVRAVGKRASYRDAGFLNHHVGDGAVRLGWHPGARVEVSVAGMERARDYDHHTQYSVSGRPLDGTHLKITEREAELRVDVTWDADGHWKTGTLGGPRDFHDNGSGYTNYRERKFAQELDWSAGDWLVHLEAEAKRLDYAVQTVGLGLNPPRRVREEFSAQLQIERKLGERWTIFAEYNWERSRCNDPIASYTMNEGLLGVRWSWEK